MENDSTRKITIGIAVTQLACLKERSLYIHFSFGRIIDCLAKRYKEVCISIPISKFNDENITDYRIEASNIQIIPQPDYISTLSSLKHICGIINSYYMLCKKSDIIFIRGMIPFVFVLYFLAFLFSRKTCHWIVGNPVALLKAHSRSNYTLDLLSLYYAKLDRMLTKIGAILTHGSFLCNGNELARIYPSHKTVSAVSTTITEDEFFERYDTCQTDNIKIIVISFIRPEKGIEYLLSALKNIKIQKSWTLTLLGSSAHFDDYKRSLENLAHELNIEKNIIWSGYVPYGPEMFQYMKNSDIFVLPTLSEGTPRVLVEARANSLPIIATNVGGIPTSVTNGFDGILVPPKDSDALADAIGKIIEDGEFRRSLIRNGYQTVKKYTVNHFVDLVCDMF